MTTRAEFLKGATALATLPVLVGRATAQETRPNVLFILTDDQPPHTVRHMEETQRLIGTPGLDLTKTCYCSVPLCGPARVGLLMGRYVHNHGVRTNKNPTSYNAYRDNHYVGQDMIARLKKAGYRTGFFGKFLNGYGTEADPTNGRFVHPYANRWYALADGEYATSPYRINTNGALVTEERNQSVLFEARAEAFVRAVTRGASSPWFCYLNFTDPHAPYTPPVAFQNSHDGAQNTSPGTQDTDTSDNPWAQQSWRGLQRANYSARVRGSARRAGDRR